MKTVPGLSKQWRSETRAARAGGLGARRAFFIERVEAAAEKLGNWCGIGEKRLSAAKTGDSLVALAAPFDFAQGRLFKSCPFKARNSTAACETRICRRSKTQALRVGASKLFAIALLAVCFIAPRTVSGQVVPSADAGGYSLIVGATATGDYLEYGSRKMLGVAAIADLDTKRRIGIEGEAQWLMFHQTANVHTTTYLIGPRYHMTFGRFQPYVKGLIGFGQFNYPYNLGTDNDLVLEPGGGLDFRVTRLIRIRVADFEYQVWPQFHYGTLTSYGLSTGIRVRIF